VEADAVIDVSPRLLGLGYSVTKSDAQTWGASFDYRPYDVVAFPCKFADPASPPRFLAAFDDGTVGVVFFRGHEANLTANAARCVAVSPARTAT